DEGEVDLETRVGATVTTVKGFAGPEVAAAYDRARILCRESQAPAQKFSVLRGLWVYDLVRAEWQAAGDLAEEMLALADGQQKIGYEVESHRALCLTLILPVMIVRANDVVRHRPVSRRCGVAPHRPMRVRKRARGCRFGP